MRTRALGVMMGIVLSGRECCRAGTRRHLLPFGSARSGVRPDWRRGVAGMPFHFELPVDVMAVEPFDVGEPVTGAPYSAQITTEILQQLADGNRIERRSMSFRFARRGKDGCAANNSSPRLVRSCPRVMCRS